MECPTEERNSITPSGSLMMQGKPVELEIQIGLPGGGSVNGRCQIVYSRRLSRENCLIGLRFLEFYENSFDILTQFIEANLKTISV